MRLHIAVIIAAFSIASTAGNLAAQRPQMNGLGFSSNDQDSYNGVGVSGQINPDYFQIGLGVAWH